METETVRLLGMWHVAGGKTCDEAQGLHMCVVGTVH